jgi:hypothetical protein
MTTPSIGGALGFGLGYIRRDPLAAFVTASILALGGAFYVAGYANFLTILPQVMDSAGETAMTDEEEMAASLEILLTLYGPAIWIGFGLVMFGGLMARSAMLRSLIRGTPQGLRNVQLAGDELRLGVVHIVGWLAFMAAYFVIILGVAGFAFGAANLALHPALIAVIGVVLGLGFLFGASYLSFGFATALPMTMVRRDFVLFSGVVVRRYFWRLVLTHIIGYFVILAVLLLLYLLVALVFVVPVLATQPSEQEIFALLTDVNPLWVGVGGGVLSLAFAPIYFSWWGIVPYFTKICLEDQEVSLTDAPVGE